MPVIGRGQIYIFKNDFAKAETEFGKLLKASRTMTDRRDGYQGLARLYAYLGRYRETLKMMGKTIEIDMELADSSNLVYDYAEKAFWLAFVRNDPEHARWAVKKSLAFAVAANRQSNMALYHTYLTIGEYDSAAAVARQLSYDLSPFVKYVLCGYRNREKGEYGAAIKDFQTAVERGFAWDEMMIEYRLTQCYYESGQNEKAMTSVQKIHRRHKIFASRYGEVYRAAVFVKSFYHLGRVYEQQGNTLRALENYKKFLDLWKNADADLQDLIDAKVRYARLKGE